MEGSRIRVMRNWSIVVATAIISFVALGSLVDPSFLPLHQFWTRKENTISNHSVPLAILHIGPRKTATTTVQYVLSQNTTRDLLRKDSFVYLGKGRELRSYKPVADFMRKCFGPHHSCQNNRTWITFANRLKSHRDNKDNIIISEEMFPHIMLQNESFQLLQEVLHGFEVQIIVTYRRYFEWILSEYNQETKYRESKLSFVSWYHKQMNGKRAQAFMPLTRSLIDRWQAYFPSSVNIFNMHDGDEDLMKRFICDMIPEATSLCLASKEGKLPTVSSENRQESDVTVDAKIVAHAAVEANYVDKKDVDAVADAVNRYITSGELSIPIECLSSSDMKEILNTSLEREKDLVPDFFYTKKGEHALRDGFANAVKEKQYCNIDAKRLLNDRKWRSFLEQLKNAGGPRN